MPRQSQAAVCPFQHAQSQSAHQVASIPAFLLMPQALGTQEVLRENYCNMTLTVEQMPGTPFLPLGIYRSPPALATLCLPPYPLPNTKQRVASSAPVPPTVQDATCTTFHGSPGTAQPGLTSLPSQDSQ